MITPEQDTAYSLSYKELITALHDNILTNVDRWECVRSSDSFKINLKERSLILSRVNGNNDIELKILGNSARTIDVSSFKYKEQHHAQLTYVLMVLQNNHAIKTADSLKEVIKELSTP